MVCARLGRPRAAPRIPAHGPRCFAAHPPRPPRFRAVPGWRDTLCPPAPPRFAPPLRARTPMLHVVLPSNFASCAVRPGAGAADAHARLLTVARQDRAESRCSHGTQPAKGKERKSSKAKAVSRSVRAGLQVGGMRLATPRDTRSSPSGVCTATSRAARSRTGVWARPRPCTRLRSWST